MSHSQFHYIKSFILRHAWLNLLDKHMTTGRINQVTIIKKKAQKFLPQKGTQPGGCWFFLFRFSHFRFFLRIRFT